MDGKALRRLNPLPRARAQLNILLGFMDEQKNHIEQLNDNPTRQRVMQGQLDITLSEIEKLKVDIKELEDAILVPR